ncbi:MAG: TIGR03905 family TSCPD domain-containing protein [Fusobacteriaceae bacterium]|nr:TIGR03905 family TSCPD domain-containing protein [Fusobacteriaceae bacterium]MBN2837681.1 TIGR03905 family TSCPD domain-containing protein [Fusobacteriaceae bacterium]
METFKTSGVCAKEIIFSIENGIINNVQFIGGCNGNLKGISNLIKGLDVHTVIEKLEGTKCGPRNTSCPDQLAKALKQYI